MKAIGIISIAALVTLPSPPLRKTIPLNRSRSLSPLTNFIEPAMMTAPEFAALVKADAAKWERIVRENNIKLEQ